jgi:ABC-type antimicrobial peptide transport system permease subunit
VTLVRSQTRLARRSANRIRTCRSSPYERSRAWRRNDYWQFGIYGWIFGTIGVVGVLLASIGVYGVLAYSVSQRTREIGVRVTLGAGRRDVIRLVLGQGLALTLTGVAVGLVLAAFGMPLTRRLLYQVSPFDPFSFIAVSVLLAAVAIAPAMCRPAAP